MMMNGAMNHTFPNVSFKFLSACIHFFGVTIITHFFSRRLASENLLSRAGWRNITWARLCILLIFLDSYLFILSAGLVLFGVGLQHDSGIACSAGIYLCVVFYASSKILIYSYLTEKVHIVWGGGEPRLTSPVYLICMGTVLLYVGVIIVMLIERIAYFRPGDGLCVIGLKPVASLSLLCFDLYINVLLTSLFLWPLVRTKVPNARLKRVTTRTLVGSIAALTTSTVNIAILTALNGREFGWVCLGSCGSDVVFNAAALFWVTSRSGPRLSSTTGATAAPTTAGQPSSVVEAGQASQGLRPFHLRPKPTTTTMRAAGSVPQTQIQSIHATTTSPAELQVDTERDSDETKRISEGVYEKGLNV
ncbi:hypothetical protein C8R46DRAFT_1268388 [Mycena filopes]|nr:hypothetical protein C8R46DRAFT_1301378 [Mycena filopes]KAJ7168826.1 hypothetical protein C8R46DRAFT_1268388 [Mycena filopes]